MKITNIKNIEGFFQAVEKCKGSVELVSKQGDVFNLKSKLTQYVSFVSIFADGEIKDMEIKLSNQEDVVDLLEFLVKG